MKYADIEKLDEKGLEAKVSEMRNQLFNFRMQKATMGIEKPHELKILKKDVNKFDITLPSFVCIRPLELINFAVLAVQQQLQ